MIRVLALIFGLLIGLGAAVSVGGTLAHLRLALGSALPGWTEGLAPVSGLLRGEGRIAGAALRWHLDGIDAAGPRWGVTLAGDDWQAAGVVRVGPGGFRADTVQGLVSGAALGVDGQGALSVTGGVLALPGIDGWLEGRANGLALERGAQPVFGDVRIEAAGGVWTLVQP